jgi:hypothetical protein
VYLKNKKEPFVPTNGSLDILLNYFTADLTYLA